MKPPPEQGPPPDITVREDPSDASNVMPPAPGSPGSDVTLVEASTHSPQAGLLLAAGLEISGWRLREPIKVTSGEADLWVADGKQDGQTAVLKLFRWGLRPKAELAEKLDRVSRAQVVEVYGRGVLPDGRHYEILEHIRHGTLADIGNGGLPPARVKEVLKELAQAVEALHEAGILHRDLKPSNVLVRTLEPLDLVLTDFGISSLAELSLHATSAHRTAAYSAPEAMTGVVSRASDWWSVGVMVFELLRGAHPFAGLDERAVNFQLVTRGIEVPADLPADWALLTKGLLTRDHVRRWGAEQVRGWLEGKRNLTVHYTAAAATVIGQKPYRFQGGEYGDAASLAVVLAEKWEEGVKHWARGYVLQWIEKQLEDQDLAILLHDIRDDAELKTPDLQLAAAALVMNRDLPLSYKGEIVTQDWLVANWTAGREVLDSGLPRWLYQPRGDTWLKQAAARWRDGMAYLRTAGFQVDNDSAGPLLASGNRTVVDDLVTERRRKYVAGRKDNLTTLLRKDALELHEAVALAAVDEKDLCTAEQLLIEESLAWLDKQGVSYHRKEAVELITARSWDALTPRWEARRQRVWLAKSKVLEKALTTTQPEYLEAVLGAVAEDDAFWADAFAKGEAYEFGDGVAEDEAEAQRWYRLAVAPYRSAAEQGDANAQYKLATCHEEGKGVTHDQVEAARWYRLAAEQGHAPAQWSLGLAYRFGEGVPENHAEAVRWYRLAAEQGYPRGQCSLGNCYRFGQGVAENKAEAVRWYRLAAKQGHPPAQYSLAFFYRFGEVVAENKAEAVRLYHLAAQQGYAMAQSSLGDCYASGEGVAEDQAEAVRWYRLAAEQGDAPGQCGLGNCYWFGQGIVEDKAEAARWYYLAAQQGYPAAQLSLARCYDSGEGVAENKTEAFRWYYTAAQQGDDSAQFNVGCCYDFGQGVARNTAEAVRWYHLAAQQNHPVAQFNLGVSYAKGEGVPEDMGQAIRWYSLAAQQGYADAQYMLGLCCQNGAGVAEDLDEAVAWYRLAAEQGHPKAQAALRGIADYSE
jgi:TPR repeat protein/serine/threonine protein kinase